MPDRNHRRLTAPALTDRPRTVEVEAVRTAADRVMVVRVAFEPPL